MPLGEQHPHGFLLHFQIESATSFRFSSNEELFSNEIHPYELKPET
jgi:hypothetical protein